MNRREFIAKSAASAALGLSFSKRRQLCAQSPADVHLEIAPLKLEIAPGKHVETIAYNGRVPGPLIRWPEGNPIAIDVVNRTGGVHHRLAGIQLDLLLAKRHLDHQFRNAVSLSRLHPPASRTKSATNEGCAAQS